MQYCTVYLPCQACNTTNKNHITDYQTKFENQNIQFIKQNLNIKIYPVGPHE